MRASSLVRGRILGLIVLAILILGSTLFTPFARDHFKVKDVLGHTVPTEECSKAESCRCRLLTSYTMVQGLDAHSAQRPESSRMVHLESGVGLNCSPFIVACRLFLSETSSGAVRLCWPQHRPPLWSRRSVRLPGLVLSSGILDSANTNICYPTQSESSLPFLLTPNPLIRLTLKIYEASSPVTLFTFWHSSPSAYNVKFSSSPSARVSSRSSVLWCSVRSLVIRFIGASIL